MIILKNLNESGTNSNLKVDILKNVNFDGNQSKEVRLVYDDANKYILNSIKDKYFFSKLKRVVCRDIKTIYPQVKPESLYLYDLKVAAGGDGVTVMSVLLAVKGRGLYDGIRVDRELFASPYITQIGDLVSPEEEVKWDNMHGHIFPPSKF